MKTIDPKKVSVSELHSYLLGVVAPRPIAFASTVDKEGRVNLSPFSFFNVFGSNPPIMIFSPSRRVRDDTVKHTLENVLEHDEVVINIVNYTMVEQASLASTEYEKGVNEFMKAGFTEEKSMIVKPPRVAESPASFECKVRQVIPTGEEGGAGNLVICEVLLAHIREDILDEAGKVDPRLLDVVGRMGGDWYCRANGDALFTLPKPSREKGVGFDQLPVSIRNSTILTGNHLARLANVSSIPESATISRYQEEELIQNTLRKYANDPKTLVLEMHQLAKEFLEAGEIDKAWAALLLIEETHTLTHTRK